jgi:chromosome partitioning protein
MEITPEQLRQTRKRLGLTAKLAGASVHVTDRSWQAYEAPASTKSFRPIPLGLLELFCIKHGLPFPPLRQDGTLTVGSAHVLTFVSATGGCGKTLTTLELAHLLEKQGQRVAVITDSPGPWQDNPGFDKPRIFLETKVVLTGHEVRDMEIKLGAYGVLNAEGQAQADGVDYFIHADEIRRLHDKSSTPVTLRQLTAENDFVLLDISTSTDAAVLVSDVIIYMLDVSRPFAAIAASRTYKDIELDLDEGSSPKLFCLLTNMAEPPYSAELGGKKIQDIQMQLLATRLGQSHDSDRAALSRQVSTGSMDRTVRLLTDEAPGSKAATEYQALANELLQLLGSDVRV